MSTLPLETRALVLIAASICRGDLPAQVKAYVEAALGLGVSKTTVVETILQTLPIAGFPAVANAFMVAKDVLMWATPQGIRKRGPGQPLTLASLAHRETTPDRCHSTVNRSTSCGQRHTPEPTSWRRDEYAHRAQHAAGDLEPSHR